MTPQAGPEPQYAISEAACAYYRRALPDEVGHPAGYETATGAGPGGAGPEQRDLPAAPDDGLRLAVADLGAETQDTTRR